MYICIQTHTYVHTYVHTYIQTYVHAYVRMYIPCIHQYGINTVGCGTSNKYTNIQNTTNILQKYYKLSLHTKKFIYRVKGVCM